MKSGRKPGFKLSEETKEKMSLAKIGRKLNDSTRQKISNSLSGKCKSPTHCENISQSMLDEHRKCLLRYQELLETYPDQQKFFEENKEDIIESFYDIKSEKELDDITKFIEIPISDLRLETPYHCFSSSFHAMENLIVGILDLKRFICDGSILDEEKISIFH